MLRLNDNYSNKVCPMRNGYQVCGFDHWKLTYRFDKGHRMPPYPKNLRYSLLFSKKFYKYWK